MQIGVTPGGPANRLGPRQQAFSRKLQNAAFGHNRTAEVLIGLSVASDKSIQLAPRFLEEGAIIHVHVALGREIVRDENVVAVKFDMPIAHRVDLDPVYCRAIDKASDRNQNLAEEVHADGVRVRKKEVL